MHHALKIDISYGRQRTVLIITSDCYFLRAPERSPTSAEPVLQKKDVGRLRTKGIDSIQYYSILLVLIPSTRLSYSTISHDNPVQRPVVRIDGDLIV